jgi:hypothetical protein
MEKTECDTTPDPYCIFDEFKRPRGVNERVWWEFIVRVCRQAATHIEAQRRVQCAIFEVDGELFERR